MGTIYHRIRTRRDGSEYYESTWTIRYYDPLKGHSVEEATETTDYKFAERTLRDREKRKDDGLPILRKATKVMMSEVLQLAIDEKRKNKRASSEGENQRMKKHLLPYFERYRAMEVTFDLVERYKTMRLEEGAEGATINRELAILKQAWRLAQDRGLVVMALKITKLKENDPRKGFFEEDPFFKLYPELPEEIQPVAAFSYITGMRKSEPLSILWDQVNRKTCVVRLETSKGNSTREIHYSDNKAIRDIIEKQWRRKNELEKQIETDVRHLFFRLGTGHGTKPGDGIKDFRGAWSSALKRAGVEFYEYVENGQIVKQPRIFHDLRRTAVRNLTEAKEDMDTIMKISGHKTAAVAQRYNIRRNEDTRAALSKVGFSKDLNRLKQKRKTR